MRTRRATAFCAWLPVRSPLPGRRASVGSTNMRKFQAFSSAMREAKVLALYDAFISYSHAKDKPIAAALQSAVQKLGKPWYRRRALRLFRDDTSLAAAPQLWPTIERALDGSRFFILLASPEAAASKWVNKEVAHWLDHNSADTLLIGLTD